MEEEMPTSATNELGKHPSKKVITELLETNNKKHKFVVGLWKTSQNWGEILPLRKTNNIIDNNNEMKNFFHQDDREITWIIDTHHKWQHSQWKALGEI